MRWSTKSLRLDLPYVLLGIFIGWNADVACSVKGRSMYPTLSPGDYVLFIPSFVLTFVQRVAQWPQVRKGDIVIMRISPELTVCKRVVRTTNNALVMKKWNDLQFSGPSLPHEDGGLKSEDLEEAEGKPLISDIYRSHQWDECLERTGGNSTQWLWLEGDNPTESFDSRHTGAMPVECLRGRVLLRVWPTVGCLPLHATSTGGGAVASGEE
uniref:Putative mitochondrial inner membrane signal peptidase n=1 Tax=Trypanosoma congolense (strain IL3000) TaxID=1068625 RepID=G0UW51_TRYCI|nr:putative mitochondrial inner membrane signal peptidase [Trypanosoma congolense IL3000]